jgi:hypothetical protein
MSTTDMARQLERLTIDIDQDVLDDAFEVIVPSVPGGTTTGGWHDGTGEHGRGCSGDLRHHWRSGEEDDLPGAVPPGAPADASLPGRRCGP